MARHATKGMNESANMLFQIFSIAIFKVDKTKQWARTRRRRGTKRGLNLEVWVGACLAFHRMTLAASFPSSDEEGEMLQPIPTHC